MWAPAMSSRCKGEGGILLTLHPPFAVRAQPDRYPERIDIEMISPLHVTNQEIAETLRARIRRQTARRRVEQPIEAVDSILAECEELLLVGRKRVPLTMEPRLRELAERCPCAAPELHAGVTIVRLMDELFDLQEELLGRRVDRSAYPDPDELE